MRKRHFYHPVFVENYYGIDIPANFKDGQLEEYEDILIPRLDINGEVILDENNNISLKPLETASKLSLRSIKTGQIVTFNKWPRDYFGDKGMGPFSSEKSAKQMREICRSMRFDKDGKRI